MQHEDIGGLKDIAFRRVEVTKEESAQQVETAEILLQAVEEYLRQKIE